MAAADNAAEFELDDVEASSEASHHAKEWHIYSQIDLHEEAYMLRMASILHAIEESMPELAGVETEANIASQDDVQLVIDDDAELESDLILELPITLEWAWELVRHFRNNGTLSTSSVDALATLAAVRLGECSNVMHLDVPPGAALTVVGDIHGQLEDLLHILDTCGSPNDKNFYIFNGDWVDRGNQSLEVLCIIMAFYLACPGKVFLNRGNHEDRHTCASYGFEREVGRKCTKAIFETINSVFMVLPICTIVDNKVMVVHGGIQDEHVTLQELSECNRRIFKGVPISAKMEASMTKTEFRLATVMLGALWSDPEPQVKHGVRPSPRGAGSAFSEQAAKAFLRSNSLSMIIRSHEVCKTGYETRFQHRKDTACPVVATIFSASEYSAKMHNRGSIMRFTKEGPGAVDHNSKKKPVIQVPNTSLSYFVESYSHNESNKSKSLHETRLSLCSIIMSKRDQLAATFARVDEESTGMVSHQQWCEVMEQVTGLHIDWMHVKNDLVQESAAKGDNVDHVEFLNSKALVSSAHNHAALENKSLDQFYQNRELLSHLYTYLDKNGDGTLSREELQQGFAIINEKLPEDGQIEHVDDLINTMDIDHDGVVSYNEFLETFRLAQSAEAEQGEHRQQKAGNENENEAANEAAPALQNDPTMSTRKLKRSSISESLRSFTSADTIDGNETFYSKEEIIVALSECGQPKDDAAKEKVLEFLRAERKRKAAKEAEKASQVSSNGARDGGGGSQPQGCCVIA